MTRLPFVPAKPRLIVREGRADPAAVSVTVILRIARADGTALAVELTEADEALIAACLRNTPGLDRHEVIEMLWRTGGV